MGAHITALNVTNSHVESVLFRKRNMSKKNELIKSEAWEYRATPLVGVSLICTDDGATTIARIYDEEEGNSERVHLIVAAPRLLRALQNLLAIQKPSPDAFVQSVMIEAELAIEGATNANT